MTARRTAVRGFTLIELMIAVTVGLTVTTAGMSLYLGAMKARTAVHEQIRMQESAYFIDQTLARYLAEAGYRPLERTAPDDDGLLLPIRSHEATFPAAAPWAAGQYVRGTADGIEIRVAGASGADGAADGSITDCLGRKLAGGTVVTMAFRLDGQRLVCSVDGTAVTVAGDGESVLVESIRWKIGVDDNDDRQVDRLVPAAGGTGPAVPLMIVAHVLLASASRVLGAPEDYVFDGATLASDDERFRRESVSAVELRN